MTYWKSVYQTRSLNLFSLLEDKSLTFTKITEEFEPTDLPKGLLNEGQSLLVTRFDFYSGAYKNLRSPVFSKHVSTEWTFDIGNWAFRYTGERREPRSGSSML